MKITKIALLLSIVLVLTLASTSCIFNKDAKELEFYTLADGTYGVKAADALSLDKIVIPETYKRKPVTQILPNAFAGAINLTEIVIPNSVETIGNSAFENCSNLTNVVIGSGVTAIGDWAFYNCYRLSGVVIPDSVNTIGNFAFRNCNSLSSVVIGNSVSTIGEYAFDFCSSLTSVVIPDSVTTIGYRAFEGCANLESVVIGNEVIFIGAYAFDDCSNLVSVEFKSVNSWHRSLYSISSSDLANPSTAAEYLKSTYAFYNWIK